MDGRNLRSRLSQLPLSLNDSVVRHLGTTARHSLQLGFSESEKVLHQLQDAFEHWVHVVLWIQQSLVSAIVDALVTSLGFRRTIHLLCQFC